MKNILFAVVIVLAASGACNPPQKTTDSTTDSTGTINSSGSRDTSTSTQRDTSGSMQRDTSGSGQRDTSMHN